MTPMLCLIWEASIKLTVGNALHTNNVERKMGKTIFALDVSLQASDRIRNFLIFRYVANCPA